ncbi:hypothetical protein FPQ14_07060 [Gilliamella apicola]|uniref:Uncharacterized protein n=1 Tax=Gilliamella apicola TaxID=1196095 RepID=A0A556RK24_9GAMM|nr:hypothetical protein [Gilliamella apicola]TSJ89260.1 hypothetical protein FPQ14_07060 [Gilliamella apicola]
MKNLTVKKIAVGLFLAGYAASSAYAVNAATTTEAILGNVPSMFAGKNDQGTTWDEHTLTLKINNDVDSAAAAKGKDKKIAVGDYVHLTYQLRDADGDTDPKDEIAKTLTIWVKKKLATGDSWDTIAWKQITDATIVSSPSADDPEKGHIYFQIPQSMSGAEKIGFQLQERTQYGNPNTNKWLWVADIWSHKNPGNGNDKPDNPGGGDEGPGNPDPENPIGPIESTATVLGIFKYDDQGNIDYTVNLTSPGGADAVKKTPKYGDKLAAVVWERPDVDDNSDAILPNWSKDVNQTDSYEFTWTLVGEAVNNADGTVSNDPAKVADNDVINEGFESTETNKKSIFLGSKDDKVKHNKVYDSMIGKYKAGIQGFKIQVTAK